MLTDQWFVDAAKVVGPALDAVKGGKVKILPESGEKTYYHWLENIEPWCISRQLWWGHQIPVWYGPQKATLTDDDADYAPYVAFCAATEEEIIAKAKEHYGQDIQIDFNRGQDELHTTTWDEGDGTKGVALFRDPDVLDTWFSSGLWPIGTLGWPGETEEMAKYFPTSTLVTGQDILFFWVARMMMMQLAVVDNIPFDTVYLHGLVRDAKGKKMSKSTGNVMDPLDIIDEYGADALRFSSAAMAALGGVLKLDMKRIEGYRNFGTKLWNAVRFAEMNDVYTNGAPSRDIPQASATVNQWIIGEVAKTRETVDDALTAFRFNDAANALYAFTWGKVCDWYVEFAKPLLNSDDDAIKAETRATMGWVLDQCMILLHPIMPFITEELWGQTATRDGMLVHEDWPTYGADLVNADADREMNWVIQTIEATRSTRAQMNVPAGAKIPMVVTEITETNDAAFTANKALIFKLARVESLTKVDAFPKGTATIAVDGATFGLPLEGVIDVAAEKARLEKSLGKLAKELGGLRGRLNNPKFVASAPEEVVTEAKANLAARQEEEAKLKDALGRLAELD
jgi:valyl-tRNA synthetase